MARFYCTFYLVVQRVCNVVTMSTPEASSSAVPVTDAAVRPPSIDLQGVNATIAEEAVQFVMRHSLETRKDALMEVNRTMIKNKDRTEDAILGWSVVLSDQDTSGQYYFLPN
jgi:hypothetical protein